MTLLMWASIIRWLSFTAPYTIISIRLHTKRPRQGQAGTKNISANVCNMAERTQLHHVVSTLPLSSTERFLPRRAILCRRMCMSFVDIEKWYKLLQLQPFRWTISWKTNVHITYITVLERSFTVWVKESPLWLSEFFSFFLKQLRIFNRF